VLDPVSAEHYTEKHDHFVELVHRSADGALKSLRLSGNLRNDGAGDWQALLMGGDVANSYTGTATATGAASLTATGTPWTAHQWKHHAVYAAGNVMAQILDNTTGGLTLDQWYTPGATIGGAAASPPSGTCVFTIGPGLPLRFLALSNDAGAPATTDTALASEITSNGLGRAEGTFAHVAVSGGTTSTVTSLYTLAHLFTATGAQSSQKAALFYSIVAATGAAMFENTYAAVSMISGDTLLPTWSISV